MIVEWWSLNWQSLVALLGAVVPLLIVAGGGIMAWARVRLNAQQAEQDSFFARVDGLIEKQRGMIDQQQSTITFQGEQIEGLQKALGRSMETERRLRKMIRDLCEGWRTFERWGERVTALLVEAELEAPELPRPVLHNNELCQEEADAGAD